MPSQLRRNVRNSLYTPVHSTILVARTRIALILYFDLSSVSLQRFGSIELCHFHEFRADRKALRIFLLTRASSESLRSTSRSMVHDVLRPARCLFVFVLTTSFVFFLAQRNRLTCHVVQEAHVGTTFGGWSRDGSSDEKG